MRLPPCYPDELIISRLIRYATITGTSGSVLVEKILNSSRASFHPFLSAGIQRLSELTNEPAQDILINQTLAPLFCFFLQTHSENIARLLLLRDSSAAYRASQMPSFSSGSTLKLKSCVRCVLSDINKYGVPYWHRIHQVPGLTSCPHHALRLNQQDLVHRQRIIPGFLPKVEYLAITSSSTENQVATFTYDFLKLLGRNKFAVDYINAYQAQLMAKGLITNHGRIRRKKIMAEFWNFASSYPSLPDAPTPLNRRDYRYFSELLIPGTSHHPLRHLIFASWLFDTPDKVFGSATSKVVKNNDSFYKEKSQALNKESKTVTCLELLKKGLSLNAIYKLTGKSRCYLKRLASLNDIPIILKPRTISTECIEKVLCLAQRGMHRAAIAERCHIGIGSVEQIISSKPNLVTLRRKIRFESKRRRSRAIISRYKREHSESIRKNFQSDCNQAYFWLYSNDRDWLEENLPPPVRPTGRRR